jgi:hypothetical protein
VYLIILQGFYMAGLISLPVSDFCSASPWQVRGITTAPVQLCCSQFPVKQQWMIVSLCDHQDIVIYIFIDDKPWLIAGTLSTTNAKTLSLPQCVIHEAVMLAKKHTIMGSYFTRLCRQVTLQEIAKMSFAYEAYPGAVFLIMCDQTMHLGLFPDLVFLKITNWK